METARFALTPFYECMDAIIPLTQLRITNNIPDVKPGRFIGNQMIEFSLQFDHSFLLSEAKKHKSNKFDIRAIIRFCNVENVNKIDDQYTLKDCFPIHLKLNMNNTTISLPQFLPNDRSGKDGRRFPRPIDLSEGLLDNPLVINKFLIQWVQDECKKETFFFAIYLVRRRTCEELTCILLKKQLSPIKNTLNFILEQSNSIKDCQDDDVMLVNTVVNTSLICPVSRLRMTTPVRGQHCTHLQCFDCVTYLIMNFNKPTWQCPVCDKKTFFCYLEVDSLILNILNDVKSKLVNNVIFNKNGQWKPDKKMPGLSDDETYNDISSYSSITETDNVKSNFQMRSEMPTECHEEKYLQQILKSTNRSSFMNRFCSLNHMNHMFPGMPNSTVPNRTVINPLFPDVPIPTSVNHGSNLPYNPPFNSIGAFQDNLRHISAVTSSININPNQPNLNLKYKMESKFSDSYSSILNNSRNNQINSHKMKSKPFPNDNGPQIKITNVTSMAKNSNSSSCVIVISDDENDDDTPPTSAADKDATVKMLNRAQKRPTTVSSVPYNVGSAKSQKLSDNYGNQIPMRTYAASAPSILDSQQVDCCCTSNNMCAPHREMLIRSRMSMNMHPIVVGNDSKTDKSHDVVDLTQPNVQPDNYLNTVKQNIIHKNNNHNDNRLLDNHSVTVNKPQLHNGQIPDFINSSRNTVKEFLKCINSQPEKMFNNNNEMKNPMNPGVPFGLQQQARSLDPLRPIPPDYLHQQWMNMMMLSPQPYPIPQTLFNHSPQFNQTNSISRENINSFINQSNAFYNC